MAGIECKLTITGRQGKGEDEQAHVVQAVGTCYTKGDHLYLFYDEGCAEENNPVHCRMILTPAELQVERRGAVSAQMLYRKGERTQTSYITPQGAIPMEFETLGLETAAEIMRNIAAEPLTYGFQGTLLALEYNLYVGGGEPIPCCLTIEMEVNE